MSIVFSKPFTYIISVTLQDSLGRQISVTIKEEMERISESLTFKGVSKHQKARPVQDFLVHEVVAQILHSLSVISSALLTLGSENEGSTRENVEETEVLS